MSLIEFFVPGIPAPQGSKTYLGQGRMVESSKAVRPWRAIVAATAHVAMMGHPPLDEPLAVHVEFYFARPKGHFTSKGQLTKSAPRLPIGHNLGDVDKLLRALLDGGTGIVWRDDCLVVEVSAMRRYHEIPGCHVSVESALTPEVIGLPFSE